MRSLTQIATLGICLTVCVMLGCGGSSKTKESASREESPETKSEKKTASPEDRVQKAMTLARVHLKYKEYDQAEKALMDVLTDPGAGNTSEAVALLDSVKAEKAAAVGTSLPASEVAAKDATPSRAPNESSPAAVPEPAATTPASSDDAAASSSSKPSEPEKPTDPSEPLSLPTIVSGGNGSDPLIVEFNPADAAPIEKTPIADAALADLEEKARVQFQAVLAFKLYERFLDRHTLTSDQQKKFEPRFVKWKESAERQLVRSGTQWITQEAFAKQMEQSNSFLYQASTQLKANSFKEAAESLERASKVDPNGIRADFILGLMNSGIGFNVPQTADEHFRRVLTRSPRHVSALNNLALTEIKSDKFAPAITHFLQAAELAPRSPEITQNLGRLIHQASLKKLIVPDAQLTKLNKLYGDLTGLGKVRPSNPRVGWLYMPMYLTEVERRANPPAEGNREGLVAVANGTGFIIHPGYVLTNRQLVRSDDAGSVEVVKVIDPRDETQEREYLASVVGMSAEHDLAIVKCDALREPLVSLSLAPRRGTEIQVFGYPQPTSILRNLRSTRGTVIAVPEPSNDNMLLFDAEVTNGNSGGPIVDKSGAALGIATARYKPTGVGNYNGAIPASVIRQFVKAVIPEFNNASETAGVDREWTELEPQINPATVMLISYQRVVPLPTVATPEAPLARQRRNSLEDVSCSICNGKAFVPCPNKSCINGGVQVKQTGTEVVGVGGQKQASVNRVRFVTVKCTVCGGADRVPCRHCSNGKDPELVGR